MQMKHKLMKMLAVGAMALSIHTALAAESLKMANGILVDAGGKTLYTFDKDRDGQSACNGACAVAWPPALATAETPWSSDFSIVVREDGTDQWAFKGRPLYRFAGDAKPGEVNGDGQGGAWHALRSAPPRQASQSSGAMPYGY
jgi:predicted lipoprotein with Yx(FWY)xxD motif